MSTVKDGKVLQKFVRRKLALQFWIQERYVENQLEIGQSTSILPSGGRGFSSVQQGLARVLRILDTLKMYLTFTCPRMRNGLGNSRRSYILEARRGLLGQKYSIDQQQPARTTKASVERSSPGLLAWMSAIPHWIPQIRTRGTSWPSPISSRRRLGVRPQGTRTCIGKSPRNSRPGRNFPFHVQYPTLFCVDARGTMPRLSVVQMSCLLGPTTLSILGHLS